MSPGKARISLFHFLIAACIASISGPLPAENLIQIYTGSSFARDSDLRIAQPGAGTNLGIRDVQWSADPFKLAPYYGLRLIHFLDRRPNWGIGLEYTHYKMYARTGRLAQVDGTWKGAPVDTRARVDRYAQQFEMSHGVNMLSLVGIYRRASAVDRLQPYIGAGLAYYLPHAESVVDNRPHATGYDSSGGGYQVLAGVNYRLTRQAGIFAEAKFNSGTAKVDIADGTAETPLRTFHVLAGVGYSF